MNPICESFLVGKRRGIIVNMARRRLYYPNGAYGVDDLVQIGLMAALRASSKVRDDMPKARITKFIMLHALRAMRNSAQQSTKFSRRFRTHPVQVPLEDYRAVDARFESCINNRIDAQKAISTLTSEERAAIKFRYYMGGSISESGNPKGYNRLRDRLFSAKVKMRKYLNAS